MELLTNLVRRVGTRLTELLANRFAMQCNQKFNEMRSPERAKSALECDPKSQNP